MIPRHRVITVFISLVAALAGCGTPAPCPTDGTPAPAYAGEVFIGTGDVFAAGSLPVQQIDIARCEGGAPLPLRIHAPSAAGAYAVVLFQHAFQGRNDWYDEVLSRLAGHGFVVVVPRMYEQGLEPVISVSADDEAVLSRELIAWLPEHLAGLLATEGVIAATNRLGIAGHSRGGKVAYRVVKDDPSAALAIVGVDPVDGTGGPTGGQARVVDGPFAFGLPSLVIGAGAGTSCSPPGDNYQRFYDAAASPAWLVVATNQGHGDMLDSDVAPAARDVCGGGDDLEGMRRLTAGLMTAFFRATLQGDNAALVALSDTAAMPIPVTAESK